MSEGENGEENSKVEGVGFKVMGLFEVHGEDQLPDTPNVSPDYSLKEERAWYCFDWASAVYGTTILGAFIPTLFSTLYPASYYTSCIAGSVLLQMIVFILIGGMADWGNFRKKLMMLFSTMSAIGCFFFLLVNTNLTERPTLVNTTGSSFFVLETTPATQYFLGFLLVATNVGYGLAFVFYNAFLPLLVRGHPRVVSTLGAAPRAVVTSEEMDRMSSSGSMWAYTGAFGVTLLLFGLALLLGAPAGSSRVEQARSDVFTSSLCCAVAAVWWLCFSVVPLLYLKPRPGPALPQGSSYLGATLGRTRQAAGMVKQLPHTANFLLAYAMFSDGASTIGAVGVLFGTQELGVPTWMNGLLLLEVQLFSVLGIALSTWLQRSRGLSSKAIVMVSLAGMSTMPLYGGLGLLPGMPLGLKTVPEFFVFGAVFGLFLGPLYAYSRSMFAELIPRNLEGLFFSFYQITDKGSSWIGPLAVSVVLEATTSIDNPKGNIRLAFILLSVLLLVPLPLLLWRVDVAAGRADAQEFARKFDEALQKGATVEEGVQADRLND